MEKISLKPSSQELIFKNQEDNVFFDILSASPIQEHEKTLGNLYVIGHIKYEGEDLGYLVSLISSLAKREFYSENARKLENTKAAFEHTLKKLNEVLEEFFQNKKFNLSIGLAAISGEFIYLSRLGKFKVFLARQGEIIDIFNNVDLFQKDHIEEKEFSNIISGKTKLNDAIFAFVPTRSLSAREKQIKELLAGQSQLEFMARIKKINEDSKNFTCCGVHIEIKKVIDSTLGYKKEVGKAKENIPLVPIGPTETILAKNETNKSPSPAGEKPLEPLILLRDVSLAQRDNIFKKTIGQLTKIKFWNSLSSFHKIKILAVTLLLIFGSIGGTKLFLKRESKEVKTIIQQAKSNVKLAQTYISQNNPAEARQLISNALLSISDLQKNDKTAELTATLNEILDKIDAVKPGQPELFSDLSSIFNGEEKIQLISVNGGNVYILSSKGILSKISNNQPEGLKIIDGIKPDKLFFDDNKLIIFNGSDLIVLFDIENRKTFQNLLKNSTISNDSAVYEQNLYSLDSSSVYKYTNITKGVSEKQIWSRDTLPPDPSLLAVDGKIYILSSSGTLSVYFKGKKEKENKLSISLPPRAGLLTKKDSSNLIYIDPSLKRIMQISKDRLSLTGTFKADNLTEISSWSLDRDNTLYILSSDQKIWKLNIK